MGTWMHYFPSHLCFCFIIMSWVRRLANVGKRTPAESTRTKTSSWSQLVIDIKKYGNIYAGRIFELREIIRPLILNIGPFAPL